MKASGSMGQGVFIPEKGPPGRTKNKRGRKAGILESSSPLMP